jgi:hypothetical protein
MTGGASLTFSEEEATILQCSHAAVGAGDRLPAPCYSRGLFKLVRR